MYRIGIYFPRRESFPPFFIQALSRIAEQEKWHCSVYGRRPLKGYKFQRKNLPLYACLPFFRLFFYKKLMREFFLLEKNDLTILPLDTYKKEAIDFPSAVFIHIDKEYSIEEIRKLVAEAKAQTIVISDIKLAIDDKKYIPLYPPFMDEIKTLPSTESVALKPPLSPNGYFFCYCDKGVYKEDIFYLLRVFSKFKTRQKTAIKIALALRSSSLSDKLKIDSYKYKHDVVLYTNTPIEACESLIRDAYACIYPFDIHASARIPEMLYAFLYESPLLCVSDGYTRLLGESAVSFFDREKQSDLLEKMTYVFTHERYRRQLKESAALMKESLSDKSNYIQLKQIKDFLRSNSRPAEKTYSTKNNSR